MIEVNEISKSYGEVTAVERLSFSVAKGELFGLIGPDGAGKTSLIRILTTLMLPDRGSARVLDLDIVKDFRQLRTKIGYMPGRFSLYEDLTVYENLSLFAAIFGTTLEENYELIKDIYSQIEPFKNRRAGALSGGMKQKLALSCAMIHAPDVIFLDEPTTGVDPVSRKEFWNMLGKLKDRGITMLVSTPYMDEAALCDKVALMQAGSVLKIDSPDEIIAHYGDILYRMEGSKIYDLPRQLRSLDTVKDSYLSGDAVHTILSDGVKIGDLVDFIESSGYEGLKISEIQPSVEDCFLQLMKKGATNE